MTESPTLVEVAAAVICRPDGCFLLAERPHGKAYAGYWEFPGGKVEAGETARQALVREAREELGIEIADAYPWITRIYHYPHASVRLNFFRVVRWTGEPHGKESQRLAWQRVERVDVAPLLPANGPVLAALALPAVYGVTHAGDIGAAAFLARLEAALEKGLRLIQVREKALPPPALEDFSQAVIARARSYGARVVINGDTALAAAVGADGVQLTAAQLMALTQRPDFPLCGASCHNGEELARAAACGLDFAALSPVKPTSSHPGAPVLGWTRFTELLRHYPLPVYALGGLAAEDLPTAWAQGAHGIAMLRGAW
ncbi:MAG TPA: Nudix family hydrolase [Betaproteobacteria bacterium]|nr:Nudix family hydrolase [Betaproteobacteria bacterium]